MTINSYLLDTGQLAAHFNVSVPTIHRWIRDGLPCLRPSPGVVRFDLADVLAWSKARAERETAANAS